LSHQETSRLVHQERVDPDQAHPLLATRLSSRTSMRFQTKSERRSSTIIMKHLPNSVTSLSHRKLPNLKMASSIRLNPCLTLEVERDLMSSERSTRSSMRELSDLLSQEEREWPVPSTSSQSMWRTPSSTFRVLDQLKVRKRSHAGSQLRLRSTPLQRAQLPPTCAT